MVKRDLAEKIDWQKMSGLVPVIVQCHQSARVLMLGYMNQEAFIRTCDSEKVTFYSRSKARLWVKGETSGNTLKLIDIGLDCDKDAIIVLVEAKGPTCHKGSDSCFDIVSENTDILIELERIINRRKDEKPAGSYVANLFETGLPRIAQKVGEEAVEVVIASMKGQSDIDELKNESADLIFHLLVLLSQCKVGWSEILQILEDRR
ncbi:MAG: bifunctional phosphoribosyl-AMP cyclohydrolase/phosphoribosyl-ATP diphosphatase HisIE [Francisellaceae bacterium]